MRALSWAFVIHANQTGGCRGVDLSPIIEQDRSGKVRHPGALRRSGAATHRNVEALMKTYRLLGYLGIVALCAALLPACGDNRSDLVLESGSSDFDQVAPLGPTELGKSKTATLTFRNIQDHGVVVRQISGVKAPFYHLDDSTCKEGELVAGHGACTVVVTYVPAALASSQAILSLSYAREKEPSALRRGPQVALTAVASLNCSVTATLAQKRAEGVSAAAQRNQAEAAAGTAKGQSLTYDDGRQLGYQQGYAAGYKQGYKNTYQRSFDSGQAQGYDEGRNSPEAIREGTAQGQREGYKKGYAEGAAAGDYAGYQAGYADGSSDGYAAGYADGQQACLDSGAIARAAPRARASLRAASLGPRSLAIGEQPPSPEQILGDPATQQACVQQGYDATYSASAFQRAYEAAAAANVAYQTGFREGYAAGDLKGGSEGSAAGQRKGYDDGRAAGYQQGYEDTFEAYYQTAAQAAYLTAYRDSYEDAYSAAGSRGYYAGSSDGYKAGYKAGLEDAGCEVH
jgi:flagellar biosynthesis/type III secretory pathway protein FliH